MLTFILGALLIGAISFRALLWPLVRGGTAGRGERHAVLAVYRQRAAELEEQRSLGQLTGDDYQTARAELEQTLAGELGKLGGPETLTAERHPAWVAALVTLILVPVGAVALYERLGGYGAAVAANTALEERASQLGPVTQLEEKLKGRLEDIDGWWLLGRSYLKLNLPHDAARALAHAYTIADPNPELAFDYARALADAQEGRLGGAPEVIIDKALEGFPSDTRILWLSAMAALERGDRSEGLSRFDRLIASLEPGSEDIERLQKMRDEIAAESGGPPAAAPAQAGSEGPPPAATPDTTAARSDPVEPAAATAAPVAAATTAAVKVTVRLDPSLASTVKPDDAVYVFAKAIEGPPMPLAVARAQVKDLPLEVTLDDSMAMAPQMRLSSFTEAAIGARISRTGKATASSGDIDGYADEPVNPATPDARAEVMLKHVVP
jgi:cytochrome c-type biogenesis protein CcmH